MNALKRAAEILREDAESIRQSHTLGGDWQGEHEAKADHDEMLAVAEQLDALQQTAPAVPDVTAAEELIGIVEGIQNLEHGTWTDSNGGRLKDTKEWVQFYLSVRNSSKQQVLDSEKLASALREIEGTVNRTATSDQFIRHLKQIATDALAAAPQPDHSPDAGKVVQSHECFFVDGQQNGVRGQFCLHCNSPAADGGEAVYQVRLPNGPSSAWYDAERISYDHASPENRRVLHTHPAQPRNELVAALEAFARDCGLFDSAYDDQEHIEIPRWRFKEYLDRLRSNGGE